MTTGLLIDGVLRDIPGLRIVPPWLLGAPQWNVLNPDDYRPRQGRPHLLLDHTTGGHWPQRVIPGAGPAGHAREVAMDWNGQNRGGGERIHSGAQILQDFDGTFYCLVDLVRCAAFHAEKPQMSEPATHWSTSDLNLVAGEVLAVSAAVSRARFGVR